MNYFKAAEQVLSSIPALERALENLQHRRDRLIESGALGSLARLITASRLRTRIT